MGRYLSYNDQEIHETSAGFVKYTDTSGTQHDITDVWWRTIHNANYLVWTKIAKIYITNNQCPSGDFNVTDYIWDWLVANNRETVQFIEIINNSSSHSGSFIFENKTELQGKTVKLINYGIISGKGGDAGKSGSTAITLQRNIDIENYGIIAGGGGGGGNGRKGGDTDNWPEVKGSPKWEDWYYSKEQTAPGELGPGNIIANGANKPPSGFRGGLCARYTASGADPDNWWLTWSSYQLTMYGSWKNASWSPFNFDYSKVYEAGNDSAGQRVQYRAHGGNTYYDTTNWIDSTGVSSSVGLHCRGVQRRKLISTPVPGKSKLSGGTGGTGGTGQGCNNHTVNSGTDGTNGPSATSDGKYKKAGNGGDAGDGGVFGSAGDIGQKGTSSSDGNSPSGNISAGGSGLAINGKSKATFIEEGTIHGSMIN